MAAPNTKKIKNKKEKKRKTPAKRAVSRAKSVSKTIKRKTPGKTLKRKDKKAAASILQRSPGNPIISPLNTSHWESKATFNPSAVFGDGKVHLIYRAIGDNDMSVFGYARSKDGFTIDKKSDYPVYLQKISYPDKKFAVTTSYSSGGGWNGGSEDPRLTLLDGRVYMLYTAFDGWNSIRIAMTSISFEDFVKERWDWSPHVFISPPGEIHKNWVLFPEKINGKYAILHGVSPRILVDYVDDLKEFDGTKHIKSAPPSGGGHSGSWDSSIRGVGPAPLKTKNGWLILYHAMDVKDPNRYKLGAILLDLKDPTKILAVSKHPVLEPDELYENEGFKSGVIYACGAVVMNGWLFVYYGGADKVVCVATAKFDLFLKNITSSGSVKLVKNRS